MRFLYVIAGLLLRLRYRIRVTGVAPAAARGRRGVLFLPNHPGLIDPVILATVLNGAFRLRPLADENQFASPLMRWFARRAGIRLIPDPAKNGLVRRGEVDVVIEQCVAGLRAGENVLLYPSGHIYRQRYEDLGANSAVESILNALPDVRIVMIRTRGLWGSSFGRGPGGAPDIFANLRRRVRDVLLGGVFFMPRRRVTIELQEPADLPRTGGRSAINRYLEAFYNADAPPNTYVPYRHWEPGGVRTLPEPECGGVAGDLEAVPERTRHAVVEHLRKLAGRSAVRPEDTLAGDLGLDSLAAVDLCVWIESEFGFPVGSADALVTVSDVLLAACGHVVRAGWAPLKPVAPAWFRPGPADAGAMAGGDTVAAAFLRRARLAPDAVAAADQASGTRTYRDLVTAALALGPAVRRIDGEYVGIMLPASVAAVTVYLALLFSGKVPVMVNWTSGARNVAHALDLLGVRRVLTARRLLDTLAAQKFDFGDLAPRFVALEDVGRSLSRGARFAAWARGRLSWRSLDRARVAPTAAVLFTSGSESLPKAVPLSHANVLTNVRDLAGVFRVRREDRMIGMLPPFHSFGLTGTMLFPLCLGLRVVYHPNPTEGGALARVIQAYGVTLMVGTPTFLGGVTRAASDEQLRSLRLAIAGAEKCPESVYDVLARRWPHVIVLEGYGITECSPAVAINDDQAPRRQTIGRVLPSLRWVLVDPETGRRAPEGGPGMLLVRGASVFAGYLNYAGPSPFVTFEGESWYRTGDLVTVAPDGVMTFAGRLKRFVKRGGEMISLPAIEEVLARRLQRPDDDKPMLAVEGTPSDANPEIVLFTVREFSREEANRCIREAALSALHNVSAVVRVEEIPTLGTGKTDYRKLRDRVGAAAGGAGGAR